MHNKLPIIKEIFIIFRPFWKSFGIVFAFSVIVPILDLIGPLFFGKALDGIREGKPITYALILMGAVLCVNIIERGMRRLKDYVELRNISYKTANYLQALSFDTLLAHPIGQIQSGNSGLKITVLLKGEKAIQSVFETLLYNTMPSILQTIIAVVALGFFSPYLSLATLCVIVPFLYLGNKFNMWFYPQNQQDNEKWSKYHSLRNEFLRYAHLIKYNAQEQQIADYYTNHRNALSKESEDLWIEYDNQAFYRAILRIIGKTSVVMLAIYLLYRGDYSLGALLTIYFWLSMAFEKMSVISDSARQILRNIAEIEEYNNMLKIPSWVNESSGVQKFEGLDRAITFRKVSFSYPRKDGSPSTYTVLKNVDLVIPKGKKIALVGHSGAGKSTIIQLIMRAYDPTKGSILIDDTPLPDMDIRSLRTKIGYVEQQVELFDNTLEYNILFGVPEKYKKQARKQLEEIARQSRIEQFYSRLGEKKWQTIIGEKGIKLSGGERQRVGIARALIKNPDILIFDEATSALDSENEKIIHEAMNDALVGRTGIIIAHRLSTVRDADIIVIMDKGKVVGQGTHEELMTTSPEYQNLVAHQLS